MAKSDATPDATPEVAPETAEAANDAPVVQFDPTPAAPKQEDLMAASPLQHDNVMYGVGAVIPASALEPDELAALRKLGVVKYRHEMASPEEIAQEISDTNELLERYKQEILRLGGSL
jgi:hypothetical protein